MTYDSYAQWKDWGGAGFLETSEREWHYFRGELRGLRLDGARVLDLGFGNGSFLGFCRRNGAHVAGTEYISELVDRAHAAGIETLPLDLASSAAQHEQNFDLITAFDVLEHIPFEQVVALLRTVRGMLKPEGVFLARFPNGQSPFGRVYQHGDHTHRSILSADIFRQLALDAGFDIVHAGNPFMPIYGGWRKKAGIGLRSMLQTALETVIAKAYAFDTPLGPNTVVYLRKSAAKR